LVEAAAPVIHAFGGAFLMMVSLRYFFDEAKNVHWISFAERRFTAWGRIQAIEVLLTLLALGVVAVSVPEQALQILEAGAGGIVAFILMEGVVGLLGKPSPEVARG